MSANDDMAELIEIEKRTQTAKYLAEIGEEEYVESKLAKAESLSDYLAGYLSGRTRKKLAHRLIEIALATGSGASDRTSLEAIREIWDRVEGKSRVSITTQRAENDPLMKLLKEAMAAEPVSITAPKQEFIEGISRVLDE